MTLSRPINYLTIQSLDLSNQDLIEVPYWIKDCTSLKTLNLENNRLS